MVERSLEVLIPFCLVTFLFVCVLFPSRASAKDYPVADGTFIQEGLALSFDEQTWEKEMKYLKELGMNYIVFAPTAESATKQKNEKGLVTLYPTKEVGFREKYPDRDLVGKVLKEAQKAGLKVILGMNFHELWWQLAGSDGEWLNSQMELGNKVAKELYDLYYENYKDTIVGWYFVWEIDNIGFTTKKREEALINAMNIQLDYLTELDPDLFFMFCPFMNYRLGTKEAYRDFWIRVFDKLHLREGDIFAPMDCVGAGGLNIDNFASWFVELRKAVDTKPGLLFWSDTEVFDHTDWTSIPISQFVEQMVKVESYVDNYITFAYTHYYSPNVTDSGFHDTYLEYVRTGKVETEPPTAPSNLQVIEMFDGSLYLMWSGSDDNVGVAGYLVYRDDKKIGRTQVARIGANSGMEKAFKETTKLKEGRTYRYKVYAYDFAGNISEASEELLYEHIVTN